MDVSSSLVLRLVFALSLFVGQAQSQEPEPPTFWNDSVLIGLARPDWVYYHVTNLPKKSVLYCPDYPALPEGYADWPKRLATPLQNKDSEGAGWLFDPHVEKKKAEVAEETQAWVRLQKLWSQFSRWIKSFVPQKITKPGAKDYLFRPEDDLQFRVSNIMRYLPPDQFWQMAFDSVILVSASAPDQEKRAAIAEGEKKRKIVLQLGINHAPNNVHSKDWWRPWSIYALDHDAAAAPEELSKTKSTVESDYKRQSSPYRSGDQLSRRWNVLRQIDLATNSYIDVLVDEKGSMPFRWPVGPEGSRIEIWTNSWGSVQWKLMHAFTVRTGEPTISLSAGEGGDSKTVLGQSYNLTWNAASEAQTRVMKWDQDESGEQLGSMTLVSVEPSASDVRVTQNPSGVEAYGLWRKKGEGWQLLSLYRQRTKPLPQVSLNWPENQQLPRSTPLELAGSNFPEKGAASIYWIQNGKRRLLKEFYQKTDWQYTFVPQNEGAQKGKAQLIVEYPAAWESRSENPQTWPQRVALQASYVVSQ